MRADVLGTKLTIERDAKRDAVAAAAVMLSLANATRCSHEHCNWQHGLYLRLAEEWLQLARQVLEGKYEG